MENQSQEISLRIEIKNSQPLELLDLTKSLIALSNQFNVYAIKNGFTPNQREAKLYIKEIVKGSTIIELMELATATVLPFASDINTIVGFASHCKNVIRYFLHKEGSEPEISISDCKDFAAIVNPIAKDNGSILNVGTMNNGTVNYYFTVNAIDSNALQNILKTEVEKKSLPESGDYREEVVMAFYQTRNKVEIEAGNKAIINDILKGKAINVIFDNEGLKRQMLKGEENPNNFFYVVDVKIETVGEKIVAYKILKLHDKYSLE